MKVLMRNTFKSLAGCLIFFPAGLCVAQSSADSALKPIITYYESLGEQSPLFNGREYVDYSATIHQGHPFLNTTEFAKATIHFDGLVYNDAMIRFDIIKEKVVLLHFNKAFRIDLPVEKITEFIVDNQHFIRLYPDSAGVISEGFYEKLYEGKTALYVRRKKQIRVDRTGNDIINVVDEYNIFYVLKEGAYHEIRSMRTLLNTLSSKREGIRQQLKRNGIKYRKNAEKAVLTAVQYYDRSSN